MDDLDELERELVVAGETRELPRSSRDGIPELPSEEAAGEAPPTIKALDENASDGGYSGSRPMKSLAVVADRASLSRNPSGKGWSAVRLHAKEGDLAPAPRSGKGGWRTFRNARGKGLLGKALLFHDSVSEFQNCRAAFDEAAATLFAEGGAASSHPAGFQGCDPRDYVQSNGDGGRCSDVATLYDMARATRGVFDRTLTALCAAIDGADFMQTEMKEEPRAREKLKERYEKHGVKREAAASFLVDIVRGTVLCSDERVMGEVLGALSRDASLRICRVKNRVAKPTITGYRDLKLNVKVKSETGRGEHTCEVCIAHKEMDRLSEVNGGAKAYEFFRSYVTSGSSDADEAERIAVLLAIPTATITSMESVAMAWLEEHDSLARLHTFNLLMRAMHEFELAETVQARIIALAVEQKGAGSLEHAEALEALAMVLYMQNKYAEAEPTFREAIGLKERALSSSSHPELAPSLSYMSLCLERQGLFQDAIGPSRRALEIREAQLGADHPDVARLLNTQANLHYGQTHYEHAEPLYRRALHITERRMGANHPDVATALNNLASLLYQRGEYGEALAEYERALAIRERQLGPEHPDVATLVNNMAALYAAQKKYDAARPLYERAMHVYGKRLGPDHPLFATAVNNLAAMYRSMEKFDEAVPLYRVALRIKQKHFGREHLECAAAMTVLASVLRNLHAFSEAKSYYAKALKIREDALGKLSRPVATSYNNLGHCHKCAGEFDAGIVAYKRALRIREVVQGRDSIPYAKSLVGLGICYMEEQAWSDAVDAFFEAVSIIEKEAGADSPDLVRPLRDLGVALGKLGRNKEARESRRKMTVVTKIVNQHAHDSQRASQKFSQSKIAEMRSQTCAIS